eukprot:CAMPEP_0171457196 /NCGR_PEP_ID=MMETSP0945-20130129/3371_1 /TAXON_ID=109269 /ORGANISM="Vaucheria litorea, Strain CCMP2940" /LENGTH=273 /DNA_ID=CAMNT_0011982755 /DNA_START=138 /DNA_END=959 /DNA_ORIENTATION=-
MKKKDESSSEYEFTIIESVLQDNPDQKVSEDAVVVPIPTMIQTDRGKEIPLLCYRCPDSNYTIIYSQGNATDLGYMHERYSLLSSLLKVNVVAYDYTGYGVSKGDPSELETYSDIMAVYNWTIENCPGRCTSYHNDSLTGDGIILYGQSLGSGPTCYLACKIKVAGIVLHNGILSGMRVLTDSRALGCLDVYPNIDRIQKVLSPVLVIHGKLDAEVHWDHGKHLHELVPEHLKREPYWVEDRGHNDIVDDQEHLDVYIRVMTKFIGSLERPTD